MIKFVIAHPVMWFCIVLGVSTVYGIVRAGIKNKSNF